MPRDDRQAIEQAEAGHERLWKANHHRPRIGCSYVELLAVDGEVRAYRAVKVGVVGDSKREEDIGRREGHAVGEQDIRPERQCVGQPVGRRRPAFCQPRFEVVGGAIDSNQPALGEQRENIRRCPCPVIDESVVGERLGASRGDEFPTAARDRASGACGHFALLPACASKNKRGDKGRDHEVPRAPGHYRPHPANFLAGLQIHVNRPFLPGIRYPRPFYTLASQHVGCIG